MWFSSDSPIFTSRCIKLLKVELIIFWMCECCCYFLYNKYFLFVFNEDSYCQQGILRRNCGQFSISAPIPRDKLQNVPVNMRFLGWVMCFIVVQCLSDEYEVRKGEGKTRVGISLLFSKRSKRAAWLNIPIRRKNRYQQYICLHVICIAECFDI